VLINISRKWFERRLWNEVIESSVTLLKVVLLDLALKKKKNLTLVLTNNHQVFIWIRCRKIIVASWFCKVVSVTFVKIMMTCFNAQSYCRTKHALRIYISSMLHKTGLILFQIKYPTLFMFSIDWINLVKYTILNKFT